MPSSNSTVTRHRRHRKTVKLSKGYFGARSRNYKAAKDAVVKAGLYAYRDRRQKKRQFRRLWIVRINAASRLNGLSYSNFVHLLKEKGVDLDRKVLAHLAVNNPSVFEDLVKYLKKK
jgi:large subunit ribosomal protein L20